MIFFKKQDCYEIRKHLVLLHMFLGVFGFDVNGMKMLTEIDTIRKSARSTNER